jgi:membrane protein YdbS with pleckstrin-like domain
LPVLAVAWFVRGPLRDVSWLPDALAELPWIAALIGGAIGALVVPRLRWRRWRYRIRPTDVEVWHGNLFRHRAIVPMNRVQHVEVEAGPLMRGFELAAVRIFTTAGSVEIPAVDGGVAEQLRTRIAELARLTDG